LTPYFVVFVIYAARYAQLAATAPPPVGDPYHLDLSLQSAVATLGFYVRFLFYEETGLGSAFAALVVVALGVGMIGSDESAKRTAVFGIAAFVIMLGPVLLIPAHPDALYLYAPHFFMALAIGALFARRRIPLVLGTAVALAAVMPATWNHYRQNIINDYLARGETNRSQFNAAVRLLTPLPRATTVFVSGVEPYFNPFSSGPGVSLKTAFKDGTITVAVEKPYDELVARFCRTTEPKRFLNFAASQSSDVTKEIENSCRGPLSGGPL
jgi:hypothetical protein